MEIFAWFEWLHRHPELSEKEYGTTGFINSELSELGIEILDLPLETGLVARVKGAKSGPTVALRCDIDALPILEEADVSYPSENRGVMHACGHDFHTATLMGAAALLEKVKNEITGEILFIFQPAEETNTGALKIIEAGALKGVDAFFGLHAAPFLEPGTVLVSPGPVCASCDKFVVTISGNGAHAAMPHLGDDTILAATSLVQSLNTVVSRDVGARDSAVLSVTHIDGGYTWNVIPATVMLEGTIRTFDKKVREAVLKRFSEICRGTELSYSIKVTEVIDQKAPSVVNSGFWATEIQKLCEKTGRKAAEQGASMGGEDFSYYLESAPGAFISVGTGGDYPLHHQKFRLDPKAMEDSSGLLADIALMALERLPDYEK